MRKAYFTNTFISLAFSILLISCGSSKPQHITTANHETEIVVPCDDQFTDSNFFRGQGIGQSKDLNTAREKARMNANQELATNVRVLSKRVAERYVNDAGQKPADYAEIFESLTREVVQQELSNVRVSCNKTMQTQDGMYKVYMAVEVDKTTVFDALDRKAEANKKIETLYNRETFRHIFNQEMDDFAKNPEK